MRSSFRSLLALATGFLAFAVSSHAIIDPALQAQLGNPSGATADTTNLTHYLITRAQYEEDYNATNLEPNWVSWDLTPADEGSSGRGNFVPTPDLPAGWYAVTTNDYTGSGFDRGHMCPSADRTVTVADNQILFYMANIIPQSADNNEGVWESLESYCRTLAGQGNELLITCGPSAFAGSTIGSGTARIAVPGYTWKIAVVVPNGTGTALQRILAAGTTPRVIAVMIPNIAGVRSDPWQNYVVKVSAIESATGLNFFSAVAASNPTLAAAMKNVVDGVVDVGFPSITTQPSQQTAAVGGTATFTVAATGADTLSYQWSKDLVEIPGATDTTLTVSNVQAADAGNYTVAITNDVGELTSNQAALVVTGLPPVIPTTVPDQTISAGATTTLSVFPTGSPTLTYQWRKGGTNMLNTGSASGVTTNVLTITNAQAGDAGYYDCVVMNSVSNAISNQAYLTVNPSLPTITTQPIGQSATKAGGVALSVAATGTNPFTYQWSVGATSTSLSPIANGVTASGSTVSGATSASLTINNVQNGDAGYYSVAITNSVGTTTSSVVVLSVTLVSAGQIALTGNDYTQNFDTLPSTGTVTYPTLASSTASNGVVYGLDNASYVNASGMGGWSMAKVAGTSTKALFLLDAGASSTGSIYSFATSAAPTDRALGSLASAGFTGEFGAVFVNSTGHTLTQFSLDYFAEEYKRGATAAGNTLTFTYSLGAGSIADSTATFTHVATLDLVAPLQSGAGATSLNGNVTPNRYEISGVVTGLNWAPNQTLVIRWADVDDPGSDDGLAVDDLTLSTQLLPVIISTTPAASATAVLLTSPITIKFNEAVTPADGWFSVTSALNGTVNCTVVSSDATTFTLTPATAFTDSDTISVTIDTTKVKDQATGTIAGTKIKTFTFATAAPVAPTIATAPVAQTAVAGGSATFTVVAAGTAPFTYTWRKDGTAITGNATAASSSLLLSNLTSADAGNYDVVIGNPTSTTVTSTPVALTVNSAPTGGISWDFSYATATNGIPTNIASAVVAQGDNNGTTTMLSATSASTGYTGATGGNNAGAAALTGSLSTSTSAFFSVTLTPATGYAVQITGIGFGSRSTSTGPQAYAIYSSLDSYASPITTGSFANDAVWHYYSPTLATLNGASGAPVTLRIYGYNGAGSPALGTANWRIDDLILPATAVASAPIPPLTTWRQANFGTSTNAGVAADTYDADGDGLPNILEYALGLDPNSAASGGLPTVTNTGGNLVFRFTRPLATTDLTYTVEQSSDLTSWSALTSTVESATSTTETMVATLPMTGTKGFVRLNVGSAATTPLGYLNVSLAGAGATSAFSMPLDDTAVPSAGIRAGRISALTDSSITNAAAGWSAGALANAAAPWMVRFTSGSAAGKMEVITANTATTVTTTGDALTAIGVAAGDAFELVPVDTVGTLFGSSYFVGNTAATTADEVKVYTSTWTALYYNTTSGFWRLASGPATNQNNVVLRTFYGFESVIRGGAKTATFIGRVNDVTYRVPVLNSTTTVISLGFPTDTTLGALAMQTKLAGWRSGTSTATADSVLVYDGTNWNPYVFNGSNWQTASGTASDSVSIPSGSAIEITRPGSNSGTTDFIQSRPY